MAIDILMHIWYFSGSLIAMVTEYKATFKKLLSVAALLIIFCSAILPAWV